MVESRQGLYIVPVYSTVQYLGRLCLTHLSVDLDLGTFDPASNCVEHIHASH